MAADRLGLIPPTGNAGLEGALLDKLQQQRHTRGSLGELESLALQLGLVQNSLKPSFSCARLLVFAADHGLAVDGIGAAEPWSTTQTICALLNERLFLATLARLHGLHLTVVDSGAADTVPSHERLLARKIAHGTRNARASAAMSVEQAHAAMRAGMEIGNCPTGSAVACAGLGVGSHESAALVLAGLTGREVSDFVVSGPAMDAAHLSDLRVLEGALERHRQLSDPIEILAAVGGFEVAMMAGMMLATASRRGLIIADGLAACAAVKVASTIAPGVVDYCVHVRSSRHQGLVNALNLFETNPVFDMGIESLDGTASVLLWPMVRSAAAALAEVCESALAELDVAI